MRTLALPRTQQSGQQPIINRQEDFSLAMVFDLPASEIPPNAVVELNDLISYGSYLVGRTGSKKIGVIQPTFKDLSPTSISKTGDLISGIPSQPAGTLNPGDYILWTDGLRDQLVKLVSTGPDVWQSNLSGDKSADTAVKILKPIFAAAFHDLQNVFILQIGAKLYTLDNTLTTFTEIKFASDKATVRETKSFFKINDKDAFFFNSLDTSVANSGGIFKIVFGGEYVYATKLNVANPSKEAGGVSLLSKEKPFGRRYVYTFTRIKTTRVDKNRLNSGAVIIQETGTNLAFFESSTDFTDIFNEKKVGAGSVTSGVLFNPTTECETDLSVWRAITDASFGITINGVTSEIVCAGFDSTDPKIQNLGDVALIIELALKQHFLDATCNFEQNAGVSTFRITTGEIKSSTISFITKGLTGTDIAQHMNLRDPAGTPPDFDPGTTLDNSFRPRQSYALGAFSAGVDFKTFTHISIYSSKDIGLAKDNLGNIADLLIWNNDIPLISAFTINRNIANKTLEHLGRGGVVLKFPRYLESATVRFSDETILTTSAAQFLSDASGVQEFSDEETYLGLISVPSAKTAVAAAIGATKVATARLVSGVVKIAERRFDGGGTAGTLTAGMEVTGATSGATGKVHEQITIGASLLWLETISGIFAPGGEAIEDDAAPATNFFTSVDGGTVQETTVANFTLVTDEQRIIFWEDGSYTQIDTVTDALNAVCYESGSKVSQAIAWAGSGTRIYSDTVTDEILTARNGKLEFVLQNRFWTPLPSSKIGDVTQGFLAVLDEVENQVKYSALPFRKEYTAGFHHAGYQYDDKITDQIKYIKRYTDRLIVFAARSTWGANTNTSTQISTPTIGESITKLSQMSVISNNIGMTAIGSIQDVGVGESVLMTQEPAVRMFNGFSYSDVNVAENRIMSFLNKWANGQVSSYDSVGGYRIFGTPNVQTDIHNKINPENGECFRLAVEKHQGSLWSQYKGVNMVWPEPLINAISFTDSSDNPRQVMFDARSGLFYEISTRIGPSGSGLVETYLDKDDGAGGGFEILPELKLREHIASLEQLAIEHLETHLYIRPNIKGGAFRSAFSVEGQLFKDGAVIFHSRTLIAPIDGDLVVDRKTEAHRIQILFKFGSSEFRITGTNTHYLSKDRSGSIQISDRITTEMKQQREYVDSLLWLSRGINQVLNRSIGVDMTGPVPVRVAGPDGVSNSAMLFDGIDNLETVLVEDLAGDFTIQFGLKV